MSRRKVSFLPARTRPLPTADEQKSQKNRTRFLCAVWWPEGYGGVESFKTLDDARSNAKSLSKMGYPKHGVSQVHVWRETIELIDVICADDPTKEPKE